MKQTKYTFETLRMDKGITIGIAIRTSKEMYGRSYKADRTYQHHIHIGKVSVYISKRKTCTKQGVKVMGGHDNIGYGEVKDKLMTLGLTSALIGICFADSFN